MTDLEKEIESKLRTKIEDRGGRCLKCVCPGWIGAPDRIILLPGARICFVETKRSKGGEIRAMQKKWREWLAALGFSYHVILSEIDLGLFISYVDDIY